MPTFEITSPEGRKFRVTAPEGATKEEALARVQAMQAEADPVEPESAVPRLLRGPVAALETAAALGSGAIAAPVSGLAGIVQGLSPDKSMTPGDRTRSVGEMLTYSPRTKMGQSLTETISYPFEKLAEGADYVGGAVSDVAGPSAGAAANTAIQVGAMAALPLAARPVAKGAGKVRDMFPRPAEDPMMPGVGAAETSMEAIRRERAGNMPVPIPLTRGQATRDFEQQRFERETAKSAETGAPLRERYAQQNEAIIKNFDSWVDQTGAQAPSLRMTGKAVTDALSRKAESAKLEINAAYDKARESGAMQEPVGVDSLVRYAADHKSEAINAGVISALGAKVRSLAGNPGKDVFGQPKPLQMTVAELEEVRKMVNALSQKDATNAHFGKEIRALIDELTEKAGGPEYRQARALRARYGQEFENVGVVNKLLSTKPGTTDRAVAFEDVFAHSILKGSLDDVRAMRKTLQTAGPEGMQAWRELQGSTINFLKEEATKNSARDTMGNPILSYDKLNRAVRELEADGKLEFIFGKRGAEQVRDITELVADVHTAPPGSFNTSNTAAVLMDALTSVATGRLPTATTQMLTLVKEQVGNRKVKRRVRESLEEPMPQRTIH